MLFTYDNESGKGTGVNENEHTCKYGLNKNFLAPRYYGLSITDTKSQFRGCPLQRELTNQCSCLEFLTAIKWEVELKVKLACGVGKQNF